MSDIKILEERKRKLAQEMKNAIGRIRDMAHENRLEQDIVGRNFEVIRNKAEAILKTDLRLDATNVAINKRIHKVLHKAIELARSE